MSPKCYSYIRFSTPEQQKGDSNRRQLKMSEDYAKEHGLELDSSMQDEGLSAFKGKHRTKGKLGDFLALVKAGKIPKDSTLIVENLDRLSREEVLDAFDHFRDIIKAGIKIVTLCDRMEYTRESLSANIGQLMISLTIMSRAHEESAIKAKRMKSAWSGKRERIAHHKITARGPEWLTLSEDKTHFIPIPERVEIIRRIFREKLNGKSTRTIAYELNQQTAWIPVGLRQKNGPGGWRDSYIQKILRSRAVIGEFQPHQMTESEGRKPAGEPIPDYFPAIVPQDLFYKVQKRFDENKEKAGNGGGRNSKVCNLFAYLSKCGYCGQPMNFISKGPSSNGHYLLCDTARRGNRQADKQGIASCKRRYVRYGEFEELILTYCKGLNPGDLLPGNEERESTLNIMKGQLLTAQGKAKEAASKVDNLGDTIATTASAAVRQTLEKKLAEALEQQSTHEAEARQLSQEIDRQSHAHDDTGAQLESLRELLSYLKESNGDELIDVRRRLREALRGLIDKIEVYPVGRIPVTEERIKGGIKAILDVHPDTSAEELEQMETWLRARIENRDLRQYTIHFKGGSMRTIVPATSQKLVLDLDLENRKLKHIFKDIDGVTQTRELVP